MAQKVNITELVKDALDACSEAHDKGPEHLMRLGFLDERKLTDGFRLDIAEETDPIQESEAQITHLSLWVGRVGLETKSFIEATDGRVIISSSGKRSVESFFVEINDYCHDGNHSWLAQSQAIDAKNRLIWAVAVPALQKLLEMAGCKASGSPLDQANERLSRSLGSSW